jgi:hypothetical protein
VTPRGAARRAGAPATSWALALLALAALPAGARATAERFSTFDVRSQEEDDESLIDHLLTRAPRDWRSAWEHAPSAVRTSQGCLTSGQWFIQTDVKLVTALGEHAEFGLDARQNQTDLSAYDFLAFSFRFPTTAGKFGASFAPTYDKSRQDLGLTWEAGSDTAEYQVQAAFVLEDAFNNLWAFRQTRVGEQSEPYLKRPYQPMLAFVHRGQRGPLERVEVGGIWLTHSIKQVTGTPVDLLEGLWGAQGYGLAEWRALGFGFEAVGRSGQAESTDQPADLSAAEQSDFRRQWQAELALRRGIGRRLRAEGRWLYQERSQITTEAPGQSRFGAIDRVIALDTWYDLTENWSARLGGMYDQITVAQSGPNPAFTYGSRRESRAYVGLSARFGRVSVHAVEGVELDPEPYEVWLVHDKGFLHLQAAF